MIEYHPFKPFIPESSNTLIIGSFPGKQSTQKPKDKDWFYSASRNQFWKILEIVFEKNLSSFNDKQQILRENKIAITDIILSCERKENKNSDVNLINKKYNQEAIDLILTKNPISKILFTSKGVYQEFLENFNKPRNVELIVLPSPSPIYRRLNLKDKAVEYKKFLLKNDN
ncbi:MAG: DNA-deoxyinosine glycosylase [Daejeonella sp.]